MVKQLYANEIVKILTGESSNAKDKRVRLKENLNKGGAAGRVLQVEIQKKI